MPAYAMLLRRAAARHAAPARVAAMPLADMARRRAIAAIAAAATPSFRAAAFAARSLVSRHFMPFRRRLPRASKYTSRDAAQYARQDTR